MPELAHEIPSDQEIEAYLREHWDNAPYFPELTTAEPFRSLRILNGAAFGDWVFQALLAGTKKLNQLPRSDPFWRNTNNRPTIYKLGEFCRLVLVESPEDLEALQVLAILPVWFCGNDFDPSRWTALCRFPGFDVRWPIFAALLFHLGAGGNDRALATFLREAHMEAAAMPILRGITEEGDDNCRRWAVQVLNLLPAP